jgi:hypothetical protein
MILLPISWGPRHLPTALRLFSLAFYPAWTSISGSGFSAAWLFNGYVPAATAVPHTSTMDGGNPTRTILLPHWFMRCFRRTIFRPVLGLSAGGRGGRGRGRCDDPATTQVRTEGLPAAAANQCPRSAIRASGSGVTKRGSGCPAQHRMQSTSPPHTCTFPENPVRPNASIARAVRQSRLICTLDFAHDACHFSAGCEFLDITATHSTALAMTSEVRSRIPLVWGGRSMS